MADKESLELVQPNVHTNGYHKGSASGGTDSDVVLKVDNLSKKFCRNLKRSMYYGVRDLAKGLVGKRPDPGELRRDEFWALKDINFELKENEILGIIGANGSGKSTLLRVLTGIYPPDRGRVWMDGTVGGIIALGAGMHPHMTGRENIYLNGTILGMSKEEIDEKFDDIVDFAEIGDFLEAPFNTYSSGMRVRLGFAVAVHFQPDILLVDEVLAVGDINFQNKCKKKLREVRENSKGVIFISHNIEMVRALCGRVIVLNDSVIHYNGKAREACNEYEKIMNEKEALNYNNDNYDNNRFIKNVSINNNRRIKTNDDLIINATINNVKNYDKLYLSLDIVNYENSILLNNSIFYIYNKYNKNSLLVKCTYKNNPLLLGVYGIKIVLRNFNMEILDRIILDNSFSIIGNRNVNKHVENGLVKMSAYMVVK